MVNWKIVDINKTYYEIFGVFGNISWEMFYIYIPMCKRIFFSVISKIP